METSFLFTLAKKLPKKPIENLVIEMENIASLPVDTFPDSFGEALAEKMKKSKKGKESFCLSTFSGNKIAKRVHVVHIPDRDRIADDLPGYLARTEGDLTVYVPGKSAKRMEVLTILDCITLGTYSFDRFLSEKKTRKLELVCPGMNRALEADIRDRMRLSESVFLARDLVNMPPSQKNPERMVDMIRGLPFKRTKIRILDKKELEKLGCGLILGVAAGSVYDPAIVIFERIGDNTKQMVACVGKGVTFDAGGLQIKPGDAMLTMKDDMGGAASVIATMLYLDDLEDIPYNVVGAVALAENVIGGDAYKPLDILRAHNGKTVEIDHTDAEGRLVLGDAMSFVGNTYKPDSMMTIATLTGACIHALGHNYAGIMGDDERMIAKILRLTENGNEKFWRLPLDGAMKKAVK